MCACVCVRIAFIVKGKKGVRKREKGVRKRERGRTRGRGWERVYVGQQ